MAVNAEPEITLDTSARPRIDTSAEPGILEGKGSVTQPVQENEEQESPRKKKKIVTKLEKVGPKPGVFILKFWQGFIEVLLRGIVIVSAILCT